MPIRRKIGLLLAKAETTEGTDPTPTPAANAISVVRNTVSFDAQSDPIVREILDGGLSIIPGDNALPRVKLSFSIELKGNLSSKTLHTATAVTADDTADTFTTVAAHALVAGDLIQVNGSVAPTGTTLGTWYYVISSGLTSTAFKFSATLGGSAVNFSSTGTSVTIASAVPDISAGSSTYALRSHPLFAACDMAATYTAESATGARDGYVTYNPTIPVGDSSLPAGPTCTFYFYDHVKLHKITAAKGTVKFRTEAGKYCYADFEFMGLYNAPTDATFSTVLSTVTYDTDTKPPMFKAQSITYGSYAPVLSKINMDLANRVNMRESAVATDGLSGFIVTSRESKGDFDPEAVAEATNPFWADWKAATVKTFTVPIGSASGNRVTMTAIGQQRNVTYADRNEITIHNVQFGICRSALSSALGTDLAVKFS